MVYGTRKSFSFFICRGYEQRLFFTRILTERFPLGDLTWTINPELRTTPGPIDLLLIRNDLTKNPIRVAWTVIFEGKGSGSGDTYDRILTQLMGYAATWKGPFVYLLGAKGKTCAFWKYTKSRSPQVQRMSSDDQGNVRFEDLSQAVQYDIVERQAPIAHMLRWIINNQPPFNLAIDEVCGQFQPGNLADETGTDIDSRNTAAVNQ